MTVWTSPINAYGFFYKRQRGAGVSEDEILMVVYRVANLTRLGELIKEESRPNGAADAPHCGRVGGTA